MAAAFRRFGGYGKVKELLKALTESSSFDRIMKPVKVVSSSPGQCVCEMTVEESHLNIGGTLHGGVTATLVDSISTLAITAADCSPGVSVDMNISYMNAARAGDVLELKAECLKKGKNLAFAKLDVTRKSDGKLIAVGRHTKYVG